MKRNEANKPFYNHDNGSAASTINTIATNGASQISSVGFNKLKKSNTETSESSESTGLGRQRLSRMFTRNKSSSRLSSQSGETLSDTLSNDSFDDVSTITTNSKKGNSGLFRFGKKDKKRHASGKGISRPDLSIQTSGFNSLKVPRSVNSMSTEDMQRLSTRKNSLTSPSGTFHNLFHRTHSVSNKDVGFSTDGDDIVPQTINTSSSKTTLSLSSNNSNSHIRDISFAQVYNFTNQDYVSNDPDSTGDHGSLQDISRKYLIPTDQFLQNRQNRNAGNDLGLGINVESDAAMTRSSSEYTKKNATFFNNLLLIVRPLLLQSQQRSLSNGYRYPVLGYTIEDLATFIKENYQIAVNWSSQSDISAERTGKLSKSKSKSKLNSMNNIGNVGYTSSVKSVPQNSIAYSKAESVDSQHDINLRESSKDLYVFFTRCMILFKNDFAALSLKTRRSFSNLNTVKESKSSLPFSSIKEWSAIKDEWKYFNEKIRFFLLAIFQPLQEQLHECRSCKSGKIPGESMGLDVEGLMLSAFKDVVILPFLLQRAETYELLNDSPLDAAKIKHIRPQSVPTEENIMEEPPNDFQKALDSEISQLRRNDNRLLRSLISCFGNIITATSVTTSLGSEYASRSSIFVEAFHWLLSLNI